MRNASKCFLCFRPPATIEIDDGVDCSADRMLSLIAAASNKKKRYHKKISVKTKTKSIDSCIPDHNPPPRTLRRSFSSVVRAVMFETSLSRRVREGKLRSRSERFLREPLSDQEPILDQTTAREKSLIAVEHKEESNQTDENPSSESDCSFVSATDNTKQSDSNSGSTGIINPVICLLLISLCVTVFWGRLCAVMTTTVYIYGWQSGAVVVGLGEMLKMKKRKKAVGVAMESSETEKVTDSFSANGKQLIIERGLKRN